MFNSYQASSKQSADVPQIQYFSSIADYHNTVSAFARNSNGSVVINQTPAQERTFFKYKRYSGTQSSSFRSGSKTRLTNNQ